MLQIGNHGPVEDAGTRVRLFQKDIEVLKEMAKAQRVSVGYLVRMFVAQRIEQLKDQ
jgi:hypothetical protein